MRDILFYDFDFNLLADFPRFISFNLTKKYCGFGTAEIHFSLAESEVITLLENNPYMFFVTENEAAVVTGWRIGEDIAVFGRTPEWLLTKRGVEAFKNTGATAETIARAAVTSAAGDFITLNDLAEAGTAMSYSIDKVRVLYDVVCEILNVQELGFKVEPDIARKSFVFSVYSGQERLCLISPSNRTAYDMTYTVENQEMVTSSGWYERKFNDMGKWDAVNNSPRIYDNQASNAYTFYEISSESYDADGDFAERFGVWCQKGYYLYSDAASGKWKISAAKPDTIWLYIGNACVSGAKRWDAVLNGTKTADEAVTEIAQKKRQASSQTEVKGVEYGTDYKLGDVVRVQTEFGDFKKTEKKRVTSIDIYCDVDKSGVTPILNSLEE